MEWEGRAIVIETTAANFIKNNILSEEVFRSIWNHCKMQFQR